MSHFTVMVFGDNVDEQLIPFNEDAGWLISNGYNEYTDFEDKTEEVLEGWEGTSSVRVDDRSSCSVKDWEFEDRPTQSMYDSIEEYAKDYHGYEIEVDDSGTRYGYYTNNRAKWDWYTVGGRWTGYFKLKDEVMEKGDFDDIAVGDPGLMTKPAERGYADQCRKRDIDFDGMFNDQFNKSLEHYKHVEAAIKDVPEDQWLSWPKVREAVEDIDIAREYYGNSKFKKAIKAYEKEHEVDLDPFFADFYTTYLLDKKGSMEYRAREYAHKMAVSKLVPFSFLKDGEWIERGDMGWWGIVSDEKDENEWINQFYEMFKALPDDTLITIVDCHI